jgi:hypothetical protein
MRRSVSVAVILPCYRTLCLYDIALSSCRTALAMARSVR